MMNITVYFCGHTPATVPVARARARVCVCVCVCVRVCVRACVRARLAEEGEGVVRVEGRETAEHDVQNNLPHMRMLYIYIYISHLV